MTYNQERLVLKKRFLAMELRFLWVTFIRVIPSLLAWGWLIVWWFNISF